VEKKYEVEERLREGKKAPPSLVKEAGLSKLPETLNGGEDGNETSSILHQSQPVIAHKKLSSLWGGVRMNEFSAVSDLRKLTKVEEGPEGVGTWGMAFLCQHFPQRRGENGRSLMIKGQKIRDEGAVEERRPTSKVRKG